MATEEDFNKQCFIRICLSHTMKAFSRKNKNIKKNNKKKNIKQDIMFFCSLLANASTLEVFEDVLQHFSSHWKQKYFRSHLLLYYLMMKI